MSQSIFFDDPDVVSSEDDDPTYVEDDDKLPDADDETSVNTALILLLKEISHLIPNIKSDWTFDHLSFSPQFKKGSYTAITDGGLRSKTNQAIMYIVEAKRRVRSARYEDIVMQEGAELVGWIQHGDSPRPELKGHLALLSGDRHEIYVTFASCSPDYQAYLNPEIGHATPDTHMKMQIYGPYNTLVNRHMEDFAVVVVSLMLLAEKAL
ncbi:similar to An02g01130 [Aspergillus luchuensis IFO 4308]|nr:similar to An02g01130 [Aspergillus luchuensis IFO 4308]